MLARSRMAESNSSGWRSLLSLSVRMTSSMASMTADPSASASDALFSLMLVKTSLKSATSTSAESADLNNVMTLLNKFNCFRGSAVAALVCSSKTPALGCQ